MLLYLLGSSGEEATPCEEKMDTGMTEESESKSQAETEFVDPKTGKKVTLPAG